MRQLHGHELEHDRQHGQDQERPHPRGVARGPLGVGQEQRGERRERQDRDEPGHGQAQPFAQPLRGSFGDGRAEPRLRRGRLVRDAQPGPRGHDSGATDHGLPPAPRAPLIAPLRVRSGHPHESPGPRTIRRGVSRSDPADRASRTVRRPPSPRRGVGRPGSDDRELPELDPVVLARPGLRRGRQSRDVPAARPGPSRAAGGGPPARAGPDRDRGPHADAGQRRVLAVRLPGLFRPARPADRARAVHQPRRARPERPAVRPAGPRARAPCPGRGSSGRWSPRRSPCHSSSSGSST